MPLVTKPLNWVPAAVLRSPAHPILSSRMLLIEFVGRRSNRRYATPVNYPRTPPAPC